MDIIVKGEGKKLFSPDYVKISILFENNNKTYETALEDGVKSVDNFNEFILKTLDIDKKDLKTTNFSVKKNMKYDYETKEYKDNGYDFAQSSLLSFDFDIKLVSKFIEEVAKLEIPPKYTINFTLKDESMARKAVLGEAFKNAENEALIISEAASKTLKDCLKIDFQPFSDSILSDSYLSSKMFVEEDRMACKAMNYESISQSIETNFNPEDIEIIETLYCLWKAE